MNLTTISLLQQIKAWVTDVQMPQKENVISDLSTIRSGAAAGATAYQKPQLGIPNQDLEGNIPAIKLAGNIPAEKLAEAVQLLLTAAGTALQPADLNDLNSRVEALEELINPGGIVDPDDVINKFNEIVDFLAGIPETTLTEILTGISEELATKYVKPEGGIPSSDLTPELQSAAQSADTAVQWEETEGLDDQGLIDEYQRVLGALYQAITDAQTATANTQQAITDAAAAKNAADAAATSANNAATNAGTQANAASAAAISANNATTAANNATTRANASAENADTKAGLANEKAELANTKAGYAQDKGDYAKEQGDYAKEKGDYAKEQGDYAKNEIDGAKGDYSSLDARFSHMEGEIPTSISELSEDSTHRTVTDTEKSTWSGKQDAINDLQDIRSGASAGSTAYQKPSGGIPASDLALDAITYEEADDCTSLL